MADEDIDKEIEAAFNSHVEQAFHEHKHQNGQKTRKKLESEMGPDIKKLTEPSDTDVGGAIGRSVVKGIGDLGGGDENFYGTIGQGLEDANRMVEDPSLTNLAKGVGNQALMNGKTLLGPLANLPLPVDENKAFGVPWNPSEILEGKNPFHLPGSWKEGLALPRTLGSLIPKPEDYEGYALQQAAADEEAMTPGGGASAIAEAAPQAIGALMGLRGARAPEPKSPLGQRNVPSVFDIGKELLPNKVKGFGSKIAERFGPKDIQGPVQQYNAPIEQSMPFDEAYQASPFSIDDVGPEPPTSPNGSPPFNMEDLNGTDTSVSIPQPPPSMTLDTPLPRYNPYGDMFDTNLGIPEAPTVRSPQVENTQTYSPQERMRIQGQGDLNLPHDTAVNAEYSPSDLQKMGLPVQDDIATVNGRSPLNMRPDMAAGEFPVNQWVEDQMAQMRVPRPFEQKVPMDEPDVPQWVRDKQGDTSPPNTFGDKGRPDDEQNQLWLEQQIRANKFDKADKMLRARFGDEYVNYLLNSIDPEDLDFHK